MIRRPPRSTRTDTLCPTRRSSDLEFEAFARRAVDRHRLGGAHQPRRAQEGQAPPRGVIEIMDQPTRRRERGARERPEAVERRSEEHTSELQSLMRISYAVFCLKKKNK